MTSVRHHWQFWWVAHGHQMQNVYFMRRRVKSKQAICAFFIRSAHSTNYSANVATDNISNSSVWRYHIKATHQTVGTLRQSSMKPYNDQLICYCDFSLRYLSSVFSLRHERREKRHFIWCTNLSVLSTLRLNFWSLSGVLCSCQYAVKWINHLGCRNFGDSYFTYLKRIYLRTHHRINLSHFNWIRVNIRARFFLGPSVLFLHCLRFIAHKWATAFFFDEESTKYFAYSVTCRSPIPVDGEDMQTTACLRMAYSNK